MATSAPSPTQNLSSPQLGAYRVLGSLGRGGMAHVFKVEHRRLGQLRALKVLLPELSAPHVVARLLTEARAMARLRHPAIVEVFDCDVLEDGTAFIAMEYLRGEQMRRWLERVGKLRNQAMLAAAIVGAVANGLHYAHQHAIVHRDLKPENILLVPDPADPRAFVVKILDFGIAKLMREEPLTRTMAGCVVGTPVYMAPEQWRPGSLIDHRADIYALGCLFFELLCGRPPFDEQDDMGMRRAHLDDPAPAASSLEPEIPPAVDGLIARMLAKAADDRPQSVEEVLQALEALLGQERTYFGELLRMPAGWSVIAKETVTVDPAPSKHTRLSPEARAAAAFVFGTDAWQGRTDPRKRFGILVALGALAAMALVGGLLLWLEDPAEPTAVRPAPAPVAAPAPVVPPPPRPAPARGSNPRERRPLAAPVQPEPSRAREAAPPPRRWEEEPPPLQWREAEPPPQRRIAAPAPRHPARAAPLATPPRAVEKQAASNSYRKVAD